MTERESSEAPAGPPSSAASASDPNLAIPNEKLFAELFDVSPFPAVVSRVSDHTVIAINKRTSEIFGVPQSEAAGIRVTDYYVDPMDRLKVAERVQREGRADGFRLRIRRPSGEPFWGMFSARLVTYEGEPAILTVFSDITDQMAAEAALLASEQRLAAQSQALTGLTARYANPTGPFDERLQDLLATCAETLSVERLSLWRFSANRSLIRCVGLYHRTSRRCDSGALLYRSDAPAYFDAVERERVIAADNAQTDRRTRDFADDYLVPNGIGAMLDVPLAQHTAMVGVLCAEHVGGPRVWTVDEQNFAVSAANLIVVALADEQRRAALVRLGESEQRAKLMVDTAHDAFIGINSSGRILTWNAQAERTFGWTRAEAVGRRLSDTIIPERFRDAHGRGMRRFHDTGEAPVVNQRLELAALDRSGREFPIEITITSPLPLDDGYFFGAFLRDISDRRERDDQLRRAKESAEAAARAKSDFLANMSHELRTPLNGVLGYTQLLLRDRNLSAPQREAVDAISKCGAHLLALINDVLDLSKIEAGRIDIEAAATDLIQLTVDLKHVVADSARRKGLLLAMAIDPGVPRRVVLDGRHLRQVLLNLLDNAIKFTTEGEVRLDVVRAGDDRLAFEVSDTGVGIEANSLDEIFEAFTQTKAGAAAGGTGLGLAISHHLVTSMGGQLQVESVVGRGSRFFFSLPLVEGARDGKPEDEEPVTSQLDARLAPGQELTALVVDDSTVSRRILASLLEGAGVRVIQAAGGVEAVSLAREHRPDVVFMDLRMSDLDGFEATRRLARDPATARIPVIAVTASAFGDTRQAAREAGCVDYLPKPVRAEALLASLEAHLGVRFVAGIDWPASGLLDLPNSARYAAVAERLRDAAAIGSVTDLETLAQELLAGDASAVTLGQRVARLAADFDFDGLRVLADGLVIEEASRRGRR